MKNKDFAIFILTHNRAERVYTYKTLERSGYTGKTYIIIDDTDPEKNTYIKKFGEENVIIFNKQEVAKEFDIMDNFDDYRAVVYARNASFKIAKDLGIKYFMLLDDDYSGFYFRYNRKLEFITEKIEKLDDVLDAMVEFYKSTPVKSIAMAQAGDFIGGDNGFWSSPTRLRKCMNTFICSTDRPFKFIGRINEDVNTYVNNARLGDIFLTIPFIAVVQKQTQANAGGLTDIYLNLGTYVKSFYTVMVQPSSVSVSLMGDKHKRIHHLVKGKFTYPMIVSENI